MLGFCNLKDVISHNISLFFSHTRFYYHLRTLQNYLKSRSNQRHEYKRVKCGGADVYLVFLNLKELTNRSRISEEQSIAIGRFAYGLKKDCGSAAGINERLVEKTVLRTEVYTFLISEMIVPING